MRLWVLLLCALSFYALSLMCFQAMALPDEAGGLVTHVADGDTFTVEGLGEVRLADINCPELDAPGGPEAKEFTSDTLLNRQVCLDIDNKTGKDRYGRYVCVAFLPGSNVAPDQIRNFNRMLVDSGHAIVEDNKDNEFNPADWWKPSNAKSQEELKKFVGSAKSNKYHYPDCQWAKKIKPENEVWFRDSEDARARGYVPCGVCHPP